MTPPRAGTFIYHTHASEPRQCARGSRVRCSSSIRTARTIAETDKVVLVGGAGPADSLPQFDFQSPGLVNGSPAPEPMELAAGKTYRLRLININPDWRVIFSLMSDSRAWRHGVRSPRMEPTCRRRSGGPVPPIC